MPRHRQICRKSAPFSGSIIPITLLLLCLFAKENYADRLRDDQNIGTIAAGFTGLTIFISCMGLFALAAFMAENRIKEIGIRKVLGASVTGLIALLSKDFLILIGVSFVIASPVAWWLMSKWLQNYPLHIHMSYWTFILTGVATLVIAILTVGFPGAKAAILSSGKKFKVGIAERNLHLSGRLVFLFFAFS